MKNHLFNKLTATSFVNIVISVFSAITSIVIARFFGAEIRGHYAVISAALNAISLVSIFGTNVVLGRLVANKQTRETFYEEIDPYLAKIGVLVLGAIVCWISFWVFNLQSKIFIDSRGAYITLCIGYIFTMLSMLYQHISLGQSNWKSFNLGRLTFSIALLVLTLIFNFFSNFGLFELVLVIVCSTFITVIVQSQLAYPLPRVGSTIAKSTYKLYKASPKYALNSLASISTGYADVLIASILFSPKIVGYWAVARTISALMGPVNSAISVTIFSTFARIESNAKGSFSNILRWFFIFNICSVTCLLISSEFIILNIFGSNFSPSIDLVILALAASFASALSDIFEERLRGLGQPGSVNLSRVVPLIALLLLFFFKDYISSIWEFALTLVIANIIRAAVAVCLTLNSKTKFDKN